MYEADLQRHRKLSSVGGGGGKSVSIGVCTESIKHQKKMCLILNGPQP